MMAINLDQKQVTQASTIVYDFEEWSVSFDDSYKKPKNFFFQKELYDLMRINFHQF